MALPWSRQRQPTSTSCVSFSVTSPRTAPTSCPSAHRSLSRSGRRGKPEKLRALREVNSVLATAEAPRGPCAATSTGPAPGSALKADDGVVHVCGPHLTGPCVDRRLLPEHLDDWIPASRHQQLRQLPGHVHVLEVVPRRSCATAAAAARPLASHARPPGSRFCPKAFITGRRLGEKPLRIFA